MKIKAAVLESLETLSLKEIELPVIGPGEVLVEVEACGICRTDMKCVSWGQRDLVMPRILGHEMVGKIAAAGETVENYRPGERVQIAPGISCGTCYYCKNGLDHLCSAVKILGFNYDGGFQEYLRIPKEGVTGGNLSLVPDKIPSREVALTEPLACAINMQDSMRLTPSDTLLIYGTGRLGILNMRLAKERGISKVILVENNSLRVESASNFEFDYILDSDKIDIHKEIMAITKGLGVDAVIPCCPGAEPFADGMGMLRKRGKFGFFSGLILNDKNLLDINLVHYKELAVSGAYGCSVNDNKRALRYISSGKVKTRDIITKTLSIDEIAIGIEMVRNRDEISVVIEY